MPKSKKSEMSELMRVMENES